MSDISLSKAVRSNLLSLKGTADMMETTQNRLATGNKVNSALDNPSSWFTAKGLTNRASDLGALIDSMANGIQTLEAADNGLSAMTKTLESMQSTLRQARQDKSFQTASLTIDATTAGTGAIRDIDFSGGAFTTPQSVIVHNSVKTGNNGFGVSGTAGEAGNITIQATSLNSNLAINVNFVAGDTAQSVVDKINAQIAGVGGTTTSGVSAKLVDGQVSIQSTKGETVTLGTTANSARYIGLATGTTSAVAATAVGSGPVSAASIAAFDMTINGETISIPLTNAGTATLNGDAIRDAINNSTVAQKYGVVASNAAGTLTLTAANGADFTLGGAGLAATNLTAGLTTTGTRASGTVAAVTQANQVKGVDQLVGEINANANLAGKIRASNDNGRLRIENQSTQKLNIDGVNSSGGVDGTSTSASSILGNSVRAGLADQFNELRDQLDKLADDASFNGINLLRGDKLSITFNETGTSSIDIQTKGGETVNAFNLGVPTQLEEKQLDNDTTIDGLLTDVKAALDEVRSQASTFGSNLSIVQNRKSFTTSMIDTLESGAGNLTLADMNTEAANLLALQTRQQLSQNSLSLASQADQSILQLLR